MRSTTKRGTMIRPGEMVANVGRNWRMMMKAKKLEWVKIIS